MFAGWLSKYSPTGKLGTACPSILSVIVEFEWPCLDIGDQGRAWLTVLLALMCTFLPVHKDFPQGACMWRANSSGKMLLDRCSTHIPTTSLKASSPLKTSPQTQVCPGFKLQFYWLGRGTLSTLKIENSLLHISPAVETCWRMKALIPMPRKMVLIQMSIWGPWPSPWEQPDA